MTHDDPTVFAVALFLAALLFDQLFPASKGRGWNNSRAATQRDVADVLRGRGRKGSDPDTTGLVLLLFVAFGVYAFLYGS